MGREIDDQTAARHKAKAVKRKAAQDAEVAGKTIEKSLLIVHTGPGKGKSTAAFGLALRMLGRGRRVAVVQFIKGAWDSGERRALEAFGDRVVWRSMGEGFTWETQDLARDVAAAERAWAQAEAFLDDPSFGLVVLDELNIALRYGYLPLERVVARLAGRRDGLHVVVTGRTPTPEPALVAGRLRDGIRRREAPLRRREGAGWGGVLRGRAARAALYSIRSTISGCGRCASPRW
jgi:cob(I)alamin adenosyltransferase